MDNEQAGFDEWAVVELMGRQRIAGRVTVQRIADGSFVRVDVPKTEGETAFTKFFGTAAIYAMTLTDEATARLAIHQLRVRPMSRYVVPHQRQLPEGNRLVGDWNDEETEAPF